MFKGEMKTMIRTIQDYKKPSFMRMLKIAKNNQQISSTFIIMILSFIIFISLVIGGTYMHERVHGAINKQYGMDSEYGWRFDGLLFAAYTKAVVPDNYTFDELCNETCTTLHMQNEIVSYNLDTVSQLIFFIFVMFLLYHHLTTFDKEKFHREIDEEFSEDGL